MAVVWLILAAQQTTVREDLNRNRLLDPPLAHQPVETVLVGLPVTPPIPVVVQQVLRGRQLGDVDVVHPTEFPQEIRQIILLRKTGQLRRVV